MGFDKLAAPLAGIPVLRRTVEAFLAAESISRIVIVGPPERRGLLDGLEAEKPVDFTDGGAERADSVARGLAALPDDIAFAAVHDGARPLIAPQEIDRCVSEAILHGAAALARRATETMKRSDSVNFCAAAVDRENLWFMETPQVARVADLRSCLEAGKSQGVVLTDEVSALQAGGLRVKFVESRFPNPKITTPADLEWAEALLAGRERPPGGP